MPSCPSCFVTLMPQYTAWLCTSDRCRPKPDTVASQAAGYDVALRPVTPLTIDPRLGPPPGFPCAQCQEVTSARVCPYCHYGPLPLDWFVSETTCVAMAGARFTGKSFYIGIAVKQLQYLGARTGAAVDFADDGSKSRYQEHYEKPLFVERGLIQSTPSHTTGNPPQRFPMVLSLGIRGGRRQYLVFRDVAGEDLEKPSPNENHLRFLANADNVLFMFDPLRVQAITDMFPGLVDQQQTGGDPHVVLTNVLRLIDQGRPRLSVVLAKFDTLEQLRWVDRTTWSQVMSHTGAAMLRDPSLSSATYDENDGQLLSAEVRSMLLAMRAQRLVTALEQPTNGNRLDHRYFAVSVLGESVRNKKLATRGIAPFRCLDPLRWALSAAAA
jgi:hypothetical protein